MPFTFSHPAVVLPLKKYWKRLDFPALIIGSLVPDFGYYFPLNYYFKENAHTLERIFTFCVPVGLLIFLLFHFSKTSLTKMLPEPHRSLFSTQKDISFSFAKSILIVFSIFIGAITHILWDAFTHRTGWFVVRLPLLQVSLFETASSNYYVFNLFQHLSTLLGFLYILSVYKSWVESQSIKYSYADALRVYLLWAAVFLVAAIGSVYLGPSIPDTVTLLSIRMYCFQLITKTIQLFLILIFLAIIAQSVPKFKLKK